MTQIRELCSTLPRIDTHAHFDETYPSLEEFSKTQTAEQLLNCALLLKDAAFYMMKMLAYSSARKRQKLFLKKQRNYGNSAHGKLLTSRSKKQKLKSKFPFALLNRKASSRSLQTTNKIKFLILLLLMKR